MRIVFAGTPAFALPSLEALARPAHRPVAVLTQPDRPAGRGRGLRTSPVKSRALALGIQIAQPASLRDPAAQEALNALAPDLIVVVAYGLILPQTVLDIPRLGCINLHASLLPRWRGAAPVQHALLAGDAETGISVMHMDAGLDTGNVLLQRAVPIGPRVTAGELQAELADIGAGALVEVVDGLATGRLHGKPQDRDAVTYAPKIDKADAVIDWRQPAQDIGRRVRAFNPWPIAETSLSGERLRIWEADPLAGPADAQPGTVVEGANAEIEVATGHGRLRLLRLQLPGRKPVTAQEFLNARSLVGAMLG